MNKRITAKPLTASEVIDQIMGRLGADRVSLIQRLSDCVYRAVMVDGGITAAFVRDDGEIVIREMEAAL